MNTVTEIARRQQELRAQKPIYTKEEDITPAIAKGMLEKNVYNRPLSDAYCNVLIKDMKAGNWHVNGEAILFNDQDQLIDGQHRLTAVVRSGCTIRSCVTYNIHDPEAFLYLDEGKKRTASDVLAATGVENYIPKASGARILYQLLHCTDVQKFSLYRQRIHNRDLMAFVEQVSVLDEAATLSNSLYKLSTRSVMTGAIATLLKIDAPRARAFFQQLDEGLFSREGSPVLALRDRLMMKPNPKQAPGMLEDLALIFKAWNMERAGKTCKRLVWRDKRDSREAFPMPDGFTEAWRNDDEHH